MCVTPCSAHGVRQTVFVLDVAGHVPHGVGHIGHQRGVRVAAEHGHVVAIAHQSAQHVRADGAEAARDQDPCGSRDNGAHVIGPRM